MDDEEDLDIMLIDFLGWTLHSNILESTPNENLTNCDSVNENSKTKNSVADVDII